MNEDNLFSLQGAETQRRVAKERDGDDGVAEFPLLDDETPLSRLYRSAASSLSNAELVALLLGADVERARSFVCDGLSAFARTEWTARKHQLDPNEAARIVASLELGQRLTADTDDLRDPIRNPDRLARQLVARYGHHVQEHLGAVYLDAKNRVIRERVLHIGTLNATTVSTRDVLRYALDDHAAAVIIFHNHPSGDPAPSAEDLIFTKRLVEAGRSLGVDVLDHKPLRFTRGSGRDVAQPGGRSSIRLSSFTSRAIEPLRATMTSTRFRIRKARDDHEHCHGDYGIPAETLTQSKPERRWVSTSWITSSSVQIATCLARIGM